MAENEAGFRSKHAGALEMVQVGVKGNLAENEDDFDMRECSDLAGNMYGTVGDFVGCGLIVWRSTVDDSGDVEVG